MTTRLRPRHQRFVEEYARDWNATAAYKRAGYRALGHAADVNAREPVGDFERIDAAAR
jgi:phage terminase small subunit